MTYFEAPPFTLIGDVPPMPPLPAGAPWWAQYAILLAPAVGLWLFSQLVDVLNQTVRERDARGEPTSPRARFVLSILNRLAGNWLKGKQQAELAKVEPEAKP